jgi:hypothetical protein
VTAVVETSLEDWLLATLPELPPEPELLAEVPDWLREAPPTVDEPHRCACDQAGCDVPDETDALLPEPVRWAVPGMWGEREPERPFVGALVSELQEGVRRLAEVEPTLLSPGQALGEAQALLALAQQLRVQQLARIDDVADRRLFAEAGFRSTASWMRTVAPDADTADRTLARRLPSLPCLRDALRTSRVSITAGRKVSTAMQKVRHYLDCPDGLVDGLPGEEVVAAIVGNVIDQVCRDRFGLSSDDPSQAALLLELQEATTAISSSGGSQVARVEAAMVLLAQHMTPKSLTGALEDLVLAVVPSLLEDREKSAQDKRAFSLKPNPDGTWHAEGTLTPECGERLHSALAAEARRDPANPVDTALREQERDALAAAEGRDRFTHPDPVPDWERMALLEAGDADPHLVPRSPSKRLHDAFDRLLERYLSTGLGGVHGKVPVQMAVTIGARTVEGAPGAPPGHGASGRPLARSLLRRLWCDAHVTALLMSSGWKPLGVVHSARTITGTELKAVTVQFDNRCAGDGCCPGTPDPLTPLVPHHVKQHAVYSRTSIDETVLACPTLHHDLHSGKRTVRLRDGRLLSEEGWVPETQ